MLEIKQCPSPFSQYIPRLQLLTPAVIINYTDWTKYVDTVLYNILGEMLLNK